MKTITCMGETLHLQSATPKIHTQLPKVHLLSSDLKEVALYDVLVNGALLYTFPSVDTEVCASSIFKLSQEAEKLSVPLICISRDLPFAQERYLTTHELKNVVMLSDFKEGVFGKHFGVEIATGNLAGLHARSLSKVNADGVVRYLEISDELTQEPNYKKIPRI